MTEPLGDRLRAAAEEPAGPLDLGAVARRAGAVRRRARGMRAGAAVLVLLVAAGVGVAVTRDDPTTRVATTPTEEAAPSDQLVVTAPGVLRVVDAASGAVLREVAVAGSGVVAAPLAVGPSGTVYGVTYTNTMNCDTEVLEGVDRASGARSRVVERAAESPAVSPDGHFLAYLAAGRPPCDTQEVVVRDLRSGAERRWPRTWPTARRLSWARDGRRLLVGGGSAPFPGVLVLDTTRPAGPDNPPGTGPEVDRDVRTPVTFFHSPVVLADGRIAAVKPLCTHVRCAATIGAGDPVAVVDPSTGEAVATLLPSEKSPGLLDDLLVDPSGRRLAVLSGGDLYVVEGGAARLVAHDVAGAAWLPRTLDAAPAATPRAADDMDGDGRADTVTVQPGTGGATVVADLTAAGHQTLPVATGPGGAALLGLADVDGDGRAEAFVQTDHGASVTVATLVAVVGGRLAQVTLEGQPAALHLGGSIPHSSRLGCGDGTLVQATWDSQDGSQTYQGTLDSYALVGTRLERRAHTTHEFLTAGRPPTDGDLAGAGYLLHCPGID